MSLRPRFGEREREREREVKGGDVRARYSEGGQGFEEPADHDPGVIFPGIGRAAVAEGPAQIPG